MAASASDAEVDAPAEEWREVDAERDEPAAEAGAIAPPGPAAGGLVAGAVETACARSLAMIRALAFVVPSTPQAGHATGAGM